MVLNTIVRELDSYIDKIFYYVHKHFTFVRLQLIVRTEP